MTDRRDIAEHLKFFAELGVAGVSRDRTWRERGGEPAWVTSEPAAEQVDSVNAADALVAIRTDLGDCTRCKLHGQGRKQIVFGVGAACMSPAITRWIATWLLVVFGPATSSTSTASPLKKQLLSCHCARCSWRITMV